MDLSLKEMSLLFKEKTLNDSWIRIFANGGFSHVSCLGMSLLMGMLVHSSFMHDGKNNLKWDSEKVWALCMSFGVGILGWMLLYEGTFANQPANSSTK